MTKQEIFTKVATHLLTQKAKSINNYGNCCYLTPDGKTCAVGCLFEDDEYSPDMEDNSVRSLSGMGLLPERLIGHEKFLTELQIIHDDVEPIKWKTRLKKFAEDNNLQMPEGF